MMMGVWQKRFNKNAWHCNAYEYHLHHHYCCCLKCRDNIDDNVDDNDDDKQGTVIKITKIKQKI